MLSILLSSVLLISPVQDSVTVSVETIQSLESRVDSLESEVNEIGREAEYFGSALSSVRTWWSTLILLIAALVGYGSYKGVRMEIEGIEEEMEDFKEGARELRENQLAAIAAIYRSESRILLDRGNIESACVNRCKAINKFSNQEDLSDEQVSWLKSRMEETQKIVSSASEKGVVFTEKGLRKPRKSIYKMIERKSDIEIDIEDSLKDILNGLEEIEVE